MRRWASAGFLALVAASPAAAHVIPQPAYMAPGAPTTISFFAPSERPRDVLTGFTITAPPGIDFARAPAPSGWKLSIAGGTATWSGGTVARRSPASDEPFRIVASTSLAPGSVAFHAVQRYDDGGLVRWTVAFTIVPAATSTPRQHLLPAIVTAILGLVVIGLLLFRMRDRHHRDLREE